jgi:hypothetical protein
MEVDEGMLKVLELIRETVGGTQRPLEEEEDSDEPELDAGKYFTFAASSKWLIAPLLQTVFLFPHSACEFTE